MIFETIARSDIDLIKCLSELDYPGFSLELRVGSDDKKAHDHVRNKFKSIANAINETYEETYGPFQVESSTRKAVGHNQMLRRILSCVYKGTVISSTRRRS